MVDFLYKNWSDHIVIIDENDWTLYILIGTLWKLNIISYPDYILMTSELSLRYSQGQL